MGWVFICISRVAVDRHAAQRCPLGEISVSAMHMTAMLLGSLVDCQPKSTCRLLKRFAAAINSLQGPPRNACCNRCA